MGYVTTITGLGCIAPALEQALVDAWNAKEMDLMISDPKGEPDDVQLVNGEITVVPGSSYNDVFVRWEGPYKAYGWDTTISALADLCENEGVKLNADFLMDGEESTDFARCVVQDNVVTAMRPKLVWPDGAEQQL